jgi:hypothetical protein
MRQAISTGLLFLLVLASGQACSNQRDPVRLMNAFYDASDARDVAKSLSFFQPDASITTWAEGANGRHWKELTYTGLDQIRQVLDRSGFRRVPATAGGPGFTMTDVTVSSGRVSFWLRPDRLSPEKKPYDPYRVEVTLRKCLIRRMTVMEFLAWE